MKIWWLNNVQAPYREPMFSELASMVDFEATFFFRDEKVRRWSWRAHPGYRSSVIPAWRIPVPERLARRLGDDVGVLKPGAISGAIRGADAMVTQVWWQPAHLWAIILCRRRRIPYLIYAESTPESRSVRRGPADRLRSWVFRNAAAVIVPSPAAARAAIHNGTHPDRVVESVNTVDVDLYTTGVRRIRQAAATAGPHRFACIGQLIARKNVHMLLRAVAALDDDSILEIAGDGTEQQRLRALALELGISDRVRFLGFLEEPQILALLARSRTLVLPSTEEVYGYTALEAHVAGLQVIVSDRAGVAGILQGRPGVQETPPSERDLVGCMRAAAQGWNGWNDTVDVEFASPRRAARDIVSAVDRARSSAAPPAAAGGASQRTRSIATRGVTR